MKEMEIKSTMKHYYTLTRLVKILKPTVLRVGEDMEKPGLLDIAGGNTTR